MLIKYGALLILFDCVWVWADLLGPFYCMGPKGSSTKLMVRLNAAAKQFSVPILGFKLWLLASLDKSVLAIWGISSLDKIGFRMAELETFLCGGGGWGCGWVAGPS